MTAVAAKYVCNIFPNTFIVLNNECVDYWVWRAWNPDFEHDLCIGNLTLFTRADHCQEGSHINVGVVEATHDVFFNDILRIELANYIRSETISLVAGNVTNFNKQALESFGEIIQLASPSISRRISAKFETNNGMLRMAGGFIAFASVESLEERHTTLSPEEASDIPVTLKSC